MGVEVKIRRRFRIVRTIPRTTVEDEWNRVQYENSEPHWEPLVDVLLLAGVSRNPYDSMASQYDSTFDEPEESRLRERIHTVLRCAPIMFASKEFSEARFSNDLGALASFRL